MQIELIDFDWENGESNLDVDGSNYNCPIYDGFDNYLVYNYFLDEDGYNTFNSKEEEIQALSDWMKDVGRLEVMDKYQDYINDLGLEFITFFGRNGIIN